MKQGEAPLRCMLIEDDEISRNMFTHVINKVAGLKLTNVISDAIEAYNLLLKGVEIDLLFLDIEMPEMTGIELVKAIGKLEIPFVFTTAIDTYAVEAFELGATDYLIKPITYSRFVKSIERVRGKQLEESQEIIQESLPYIFVRSNHKIIKIMPEEIDYVEALSDYILIHTSKNKFVVHATMKSIEDKFSKFRNLVRIHRSYIVNMEYVEGIQDIHVLFKGKNLPIGRSYRSKFIEKLDIL